VGHMGTYPEMGKRLESSPLKGRLDIK